MSPSPAIAVYQRDCSFCHGSRGNGTAAGPKLAGAGTALVDYMLSTGRMPLAHPGDRMTRHPPRYDASTRAALVAYVSSFGPGGPPIPRLHPGRGDLGTGSQLYQLNCAACHSAAGQGGALLTQSAPSLHQATEAQTAEAIRAGPTPMPVFGSAALSDRQLRDVVAYVQYLRHPDDRGGASIGHLGPLPEGAVAWTFGLGVLVGLTVLIERKRSDDA